MIFVVHWLSHVLLLATPWPAAHHTPLSSTFSQSSLRFMSTESVMLSNHLILCHPLLLVLSVFSNLWASFHLVFMCILPKAMYRFSAIPIKLPVAFFSDLEQNILQFVWKDPTPPPIAEAILGKKNETGRIRLPDFRAYLQSYSNHDRRTEI